MAKLKERGEWLVNVGCLLVLLGQAVNAEVLILLSKLQIFFVMQAGQYLRIWRSKPF